MKQRPILVLLMIVLVAAIVYAVWYDPYQQPSPSSQTTGVRRSETGGRGLRPGPGEIALNLDLLERMTDDYSEVKRDIFHFYVPPRAPAPPPPVVRKPLPPPPPVVKTPPPSPPPAPGVAATRFTYLGQLDKEGVLSVFLAAGEELFVVKKGMRFGKEKQFQVEDLTEEEISIRQQGRDPLTRVALSDPDMSQVSMPGYAPANSRRQVPALQRKVPPIQRPQLKSFKRFQP